MVRLFGMDFGKRVAGWVQLGRAAATGHNGHPGARSGANYVVD